MCDQFYIREIELIIIELHIKNNVLWYELTTIFMKHVICT